MTRLFHPVRSVLAAPGGLIEMCDGLGALLCTKGTAEGSSAM
eukprot:CAMPEP_0182524978 /NCGR_PEP_ID=MMETSP1323-20130603/2173_1 /TAXON_ID=236787 /ORGANISM="Florenciella parvula, Strain RCC1693" /LENGTH=41 /DNA_ID= /DNA_START= /DNA_END= /DNA_ORIENTATION=